MPRLDQENSMMYILPVYIGPVFVYINNVSGIEVEGIGRDVKSLTFIGLHLAVGLVMKFPCYFCLLFTDIHEVLFVSFQVTSMLHMLLMCAVFRLATSKEGSTLLVKVCESIVRWPYLPQACSSIREI